MKKKWWMAGGAFGVGAAMLLASGFSAMASTSGYEAYDAALERTTQAVSLTARADLTVTDNGKSLFAGASEIRWNEAQRAGSVVATAHRDGETHGANIYVQDGQFVVKTADSDAYRVKPLDGETDKGRSEKPHGPPQAALQLFDALTGNVRELATVETAPDGGQRAALHLSGSRVPAIANALGALATAGLSERGAAGAELPKLTEAVKVERIDLDADIGADGRLEEQTASIVLTGRDEAGVKHELELALRIDFSDYDVTTPERIDLAGKTVEPLVDAKGPHGGWRR
ncbi:hypothetical protein [Cohnella sp. JJ-181]|uniref:hypothetical protein n=1 Tax=Cohnella rhizoplanae TaxID=2974897 RepID=UPI0022FF741E|nr:hypothetical protein [Cohnella sp. JJ-181]CAI6052694.1 hypothetical protein COHCIP112018_01543 [Cohnella sp. JJ-181]